MIFKTITDLQGKTTLGTNFGNIKEFLTRKYILSDSDISAIKAYNKEIQACTDYRTAKIRTMQNASNKAKDLVEQANGNTVALGNLTRASKAAAFGMKAISTAINMVSYMAIAEGIELVITSLSDAIQKSERFKESAKNISSEFNNLHDSFGKNSSTLSELQIKYDELSDGVNSLGKNVHLSKEKYDEYKDVMSQISDIMPEMKMRYNSQGQAVGALTGKIINLNEEYEKLQSHKIIELFNKKDENGNNFYDVMNNAEIRNEPNSILKEGKLIVDDYNDMFHSLMDGNLMDFAKKGISNSILNGGGLGHVGAFYHLYKIISDFVTKPIDEQIEELSYEIQNGKYTGNELGEKQAKLQELQGQQKEQLDVWRNYANGYSQIYDKDANDKADLFDLAKNKQSFLSSFFNNMTPGFMKQNKLTSQSTVADFVSQWIDALGNENGEISKAFNELLDFDIDTKEMTPEEVNAAIDNLISKLLQAMKSSGIKVDDSDTGITQFKATWGIEFVDENAKDYANLLKQFYSKDFLGNKLYDNKAKLVMPESSKLNSQEDIEKWSQANNVTTEELDELTKKGYNATTSINELTNALTEIRKVQKEINKFASSTSQLVSMKTGISSISSILGEKKEKLSSKKTRKKGIRSDTLAGMPEEVKTQTKEYERFVKVLKNGSSGMDKCKDAAKELAAAYITNGNLLTTLTDTEKESCISMLEEMGVKNAAAIAEDALTASRQTQQMKTEALAAATQDMGKETSDATNEFIAQANMTDLARVALVKLISTQGIFQQDISTSDKVKELNKLALAYFGVSNAIQISSAMGADPRYWKKTENYENAVREQWTNKVKEQTKLIVDSAGNVEVETGNRNKNKDKNKDKDKKSTQQIK